MFNILLIDSRRRSNKYSCQTKCQEQDLQGQRGRSALMMAVAARNNEIVGLLVEAEADQDLQDNEGNTARDLAEQYSNPDALAILAGGS